MGTVIVCAEDINFRVTVDRNVVALGSSVQLTLTVEGTQHFDPIKLPELDGFDSRYLGPSSRLSIVNGRSSASISFIFNLYPTRTGDLEIPAFYIKYEEKEYKTDPIKIKVVDQAGAETGDPQGAISLSDKIFLVLTSSKSQVYLGEKMPIHIRLFVSGLPVRNIQYPEFAHEGFMVEDYLEPKKSQRVVNGVAYDIIEFTTFVYPTQTGSLTIGPAKEVCDILSKSRSSRSGGFGDIFDDDFFAGFFETYNTRSHTVESNPLRIEVIPLPQEGRPENFSGAVGDFQFDLTVSPKRIKVGDPLTVKMRISGQGNLKDVIMPSLKDQGIDETSFKIYEPQIKQKDDGKELEQVVIPRSDKVSKFPAIQFNFFDVNDKRYVTKTQGPIALAVEKLSESEKMHVVGLSQDSMPQAQEQLGRDVVFIKNLPGKFYPVGFALYKSKLVLFGIFLMVGIWTLLFFIYRFTHKLRTDEKFARRLIAPRKAKKQLAHARILMGQSRQKEYYDTLFKMLQDYLGNKFHMSPGSITTEKIENFILSRKGNPDAVISKIREVFEQSEMVRFAAIDLDQDKMQDCYRKAQEIIDYFERLK